MTRRALSTAPRKVVTRSVGSVPARPRSAIARARAWFEVTRSSPRETGAGVRQQVARRAPTSYRAATMLRLEPRQPPLALRSADARARSLVTYLRGRAGATSVHELVVRSK